MRIASRPLAVLLAIVLSSSAVADDPPVGVQLVTRRYDVAWLLVGLRADNAPDPEMRPLGRDDLVGLPAPSVSEGRAALIELIREAIDPGSWRGKGGAIGQIALDGNALVVTQTGENHRLLVSMIEQFKESDAAPARVQSKFEGTYVDPLALRQVALADALADFSKRAGLDVGIEWLSVQGITARTPVAVTTGRLRAPLALRAILRAAGLPPDATWEYTARSLSVIAPAQPKQAQADEVSSRVYMALRYLPVRAAGLPAEPKPRRAKVVEALVAKLAREFPKAALRETGGCLIARATGAEHARLSARLEQLEIGQ